MTLSCTSTVCTLATKFEPVTMRSPLIVAPEHIIGPVVRLLDVSAFAATLVYAVNVLQTMLLELRSLVAILLALKVLVVMLVVATRVLVLILVLVTLFALKVLVVMLLEAVMVVAFTLFTVALLALKVLVVMLLVATRVLVVVSLVVTLLVFMVLNTEGPVKVMLLHVNPWVVIFEKVTLSLGPSPRFARAVALSGTSAKLLAIAR